MFKLILTSRWFFFLFALIVVFSILGCASTQLLPDADTDKWIGKITGMAKGDLELFIKQTQGQGDLHSVTGPFVMNLGTTAGGYGNVTVRGRMKGKVNNESMKAKIYGEAQVEDSFYQIFGDIIGTVSKTQASGTWTIRHVEGTHSGKWTAGKVVE